MNLRVIVEGDRMTIVALEIGERCPAGDFLQHELDDELQRTTALFSVMADLGHVRDRRKSKALTDYDDLFEFLPTAEIRFLWCYLPGKRVVLLDAFRKRTMKSSWIRSRYKAAARLAAEVRKRRG